MKTRRGRGRKRRSRRIRRDPTINVSRTQQYQQKEHCRVPHQCTDSGNTVQFALTQIGLYLLTAYKKANHGGITLLLAPCNSNSSVDTYFLLQEFTPSISEVQPWHTTQAPFCSLCIMYSVRSFCFTRTHNITDNVAVAKQTRSPHESRCVLTMKLSTDIVMCRNFQVQTSKSYFTS